jgi:DNA-binding MltR family transcriptional regulator
MRSKPPIHHVTIAAVDVDGRQSHPMNFSISRQGIWQYYDEDEKAVAESIAKQSDRAAAVIAGSIIEVRMKDAILSALKRNKDIEDFFFQPSGPMGSFRVKVDLCYMLGLLSDDAYRDLSIIKDIRNAFAHRLDIRDFKTQSISDRCFSLKLIEKYVVNTKFAKGESILLLGKPADDAQPRLAVFNYSQKMKQARQRYLVTAQLITISFALIRSIRFPPPVI